jgi:hypothetical protein
VFCSLWAGLLAGGFALARDRRRALLDVSLHLIAAGVVVLVLRAAGGWFLHPAGADQLTREALAGVWAAFTAGVRGWALTLSFVGLVTAASAQSVSAGFVVTRWPVLGFVNPPEVHGAGPGGAPAQAVGATAAV